MGFDPLVVINANRNELEKGELARGRERQRKKLCKNREGTMRPSCGGHFAFLAGAKQLVDVGNR